MLDDGLGLTGDEATGVAIVRNALGQPLRWIAQNAGHDGNVVVEKVRELPWGEGLNAATGEYVDLVKAGIVDPVKVTRNAVANAASIAGLLLTTESIVVEKPARRQPRRPPVARPQPRWPRPPARPGLLSPESITHTASGDGARSGSYPAAL